MDVNEAWGKLSELARCRTQNILDDVQKIVFTGIWEGKKYLEIALNAGYTEEHIRKVGSKLFRIIENSLKINFKVKKSNLKTTLKQYLSDEKLDKEAVKSSHYLEPEKLQYCHNKIVEQEALIRIKAPQKMGKTLLLNKIIDRTD